MVENVDNLKNAEHVGNITFREVAQLKALLEQYPYYQPLHLLLAKANIQKAEEASSLATAALYTNGQLLHNVVFKAGSAEEEWPLRDFTVIEYTAAAMPAEEPMSEAEEPVHEETDLKDQETSLEEISAQADADEQEIFDEIGEIGPHEFESISVPQKEIDPPIAVPIIETAEVLEEELVLENIVSSDFFAFEQKFDPDHTVPAEAEEPEAEKAEESQVSNYHDDKLPYTFLWWLAKTRKEHQSGFQPYVSLKKQASADLQQQYIEHIFHLQSPFNAEEILNSSATVPHADPKEVEIIDNFIKNAPQIGTPNAEQIDNENKARKSAEDHNDVVSETLAKIYIEQMLYHKAIDTYEKLSLKFPEKSRYFADLIQSIKKKI